jgi:hypothetical protein
MLLKLQIYYIVIHKFIQTININQCLQFATQSIKTTYPTHIEKLKSLVLSSI